MSQTFAGKVVLVTGGTSGIGRATAIAFAREGAKVVVSGRREKAGQETVALVQKAGGEGYFVQTDITDEAQVAALVAKTVEKFGRLDIAFNNAGVESEMHSATDFSVEEYNTVFDTNVKGVFLSLKYEIPALLKSGGGSIVNTSSVVGSKGMANFGAYVASKHAVNGLSKSAALEYAAQGIRINTVSPAAIETDMFNRLTGGVDAEAGKSLAANHPVGRVGTSEEVAAAVLFLSAPNSGFITGHDLFVDGGYMTK